MVRRGWVINFDAERRDQAGSTIGQQVADRLVRRLVRRLQAVPAGLLADEGARDLWDEICVQTRLESPWSQLYLDYMEAHLQSLVAQLVQTDRLAIWLETYAGECLIHDDEPVSLIDALAAVDDRQIVDHLISQHVTGEAWSYKNARIRAMTGE